MWVEDSDCSPEGYPNPKIHPEEAKLCATLAKKMLDRQNKVYLSGKKHLRALAKELRSYGYELEW